jgi:CCR4-NOT transcription complex subunit 7/8
MPPPVQRYGGPSNIFGHHQQYQIPLSQSQSSGLPPPSHGSHPGFSNPNTSLNPFAVSGNALSLAGSYGGTASLGGSNGAGLGSREAQMGFAQGATAMQQQADAMSDISKGGPSQKSRIREVYKNNLEEELSVLRTLVDKYPYISMVSRCILPVASSFRLTTFI